MRVWCNTCREMAEVMDVYFTDTGDRTDMTTEYVACPLACGHDAGDGGGLPYQPRSVSPARRRAMVERVAELQNEATE